MKKKTFPQIIAERPEISKLVYDKFPESKGEMECAQEKRDMDRLRWNMAKRLYYGEEKEKKEYK
jgi:hypothetical protein